LLNLQRVTNGLIATKIYKVMLNIMLIQGGLIESKIGDKLVSIKANGGFVFVRLVFLCRSRRKCFLFLWQSIVVHIQKTW